MSTYNFFCYLNKDKKEVITFIPEETIKEVSITKEIYEKLFMQSSQIKYNKLRISNIGLYSIARPDMSLYISNIIKTDIGTNITITDALANVGGMTLRFASIFNKVIACEIIPLHCDILTNNLKIYSLNKKVDIKCGDYMKIMNIIQKQDVIFFDPPWGGVDYKKAKYISLGINNINIVCIINNVLTKAKYIYLLTPYNYNLQDLVELNNEYTVIRLDKERGSKSKLLIKIKGLL